MTYKAFISYSHAADNRLAPALQSGLQSFAKPWHKLRAYRIFRDKTSLAMTPKLWPSIQAALDDSEYFLLLASVESSKSLWVQREVEHWVQHRSVDKLLIVVTSSTPLLAQDARIDFKWIQENLLSQSLAVKFLEEPLYLDLRWVRSERDLSARNPRFQDEIAGLSGTLTNRPKDELIGEDVKQHRRLRRFTWSAVLGLIILTVSSLLGALYATWQRDVARARQLAATSAVSQDFDAELSVLFAAEAVSATWRWGHVVLPEAEDQMHRAVMASRVRLTLVGHSKPVRALAWSPDGTRIATASEDCVAKVWDSDNGREILTLNGHKDRILGVAWSPDGKRLATASVDETVRVWDAVSGRQLVKLIGHGSAVWAVAWNPDGRRLASGGSDGKARVWDAISGRPLFMLGPSDVVLAVAWSPRGDRIATGGSFGAEIWDVKIGKRVHWLSTGDPGDNVFGIAWSPDGKRLATSSLSGTGNARVWNAISGKQLQVLSGHMDSVWTVAWSPDGKRLATGSWDETAKAWDPDTGKELMTLRGHSKGVVSVAWSRDGKWLATGSYDGTAKLWNMGVVGELASFSGHNGAIRDVAWSTDGRRLATASDDGTAKIWDAQGGKEPISLDGRGKHVWSVAWSPDGKQVATASRVWDAASGRLLGDLPLGLDIISWSPDGRTLAGTNWSNLRLVDAKSRKELLTIGRKDDNLVPIEILCIAWSPDGSHLAVGEYHGRADIWDAASGNELRALMKSDVLNQVKGIAWSPDGKRLATGDGFGTIRVWRVSDGQELLSLNAHGQVQSLAWGPDDNRLAVVRQDGKVAVWEVANGRELLTLGDGNSHLSRAAWSPDGKRLAVASEEGILNVYAMDIHDLMELARERVTAHPSEDGCKKYLHVEKCPPVPKLSFW